MSTGTTQTNVGCNIEILKANNAFIAFITVTLTLTAALTHGSHKKWSPLRYRYTNLG